MQILHIGYFLSFPLGVSVDEELLVIYPHLYDHFLDVATIPDVLEMDDGGRRCILMVLRVFVELFGVEGRQLLILILSLLTNCDLVVKESKQVLIKILLLSDHS